LDSPNFLVRIALGASRSWNISSTCSKTIYHKTLRKKRPLTPTLPRNGKFFQCSIAKSQELVRLFYPHRELQALGLSLRCRLTYSFITPDQRIIQFRGVPNDLTRVNDSDKHQSRGPLNCSTRVGNSDKILTDSAKIKDSVDVGKTVNDFLECWVTKILTQERADANSSPSKFYWNQYFKPPREVKTGYSGQIIIHGDKHGDNPSKADVSYKASKVTIACPASALSHIYNGLHPKKDPMVILPTLDDQYFRYRCSNFVDVEGVETLEIQIFLVSKGGADVSDTASFVLQSWAMKALRDPTYSLVAHLKQHGAVEQRVMESKPTRPVSASGEDVNPQAADKDWDRYATAFKATELDRLMIEEAAKAEGSLRMVLDKPSRQVIGLDEYGKRIIGRATRSLSDRNPDRPAGGKSNDSKDLNGTEGGAGKRKLDEDIESVRQVEKKTRVTEVL
jgi:hypothetical protein